MNATKWRPRPGRIWLSLVRALGALEAVAALVAGCAPGKSTPDLAQHQILRMALQPFGNGDVATLDPDIATDPNSQTVIDLIYDPLVTLDRQARVENWGAERVDISADGLTYTFHMRGGQGFADGKPVTAANYAYSMNRTLNPCAASPVSYYLYAIKNAERFNDQICKNGELITYPGQSGPPLTTLLGDSINVPDSATLVVTLERPAAYFLTALTYPVDAALDPSVVGPDPANESWHDTLNKGPHGQGTSGMFAVSVWDHRAGKLVLKPNPHWWGLRAGKRPYLTEIDVVIFSEFSNNSLNAYQRGQVDIAFPDATVQSAAQTQRDFHRVPLFTEYALTMEWTRAPYDNPDARTALCLAVDRDALNQQVYGGRMWPTWHIVPRGMPGYNLWLTGPDGVSSTRGDPAAARAHWQAYLDSLHGAKPPQMTYYYNLSSRTQTDLAWAIAQQWRTVLGVLVEIRGWSHEYLDTPAVTLPLTRFGWQADYPDPQDFLSLLLTAKAPYNPGGVNVPAADKLTDQADVTGDPALRTALYNDAEQLYVNAVAWCPLFQGTTGYLQRAAVHGWMLDGRSLTPNDAWLATYIART